MPEFMPVIIVFAVIVFIALAVLGAAQARKRRQALAAWAHQRGLSFSQTKDHSFDERFAEFDCLKQGSNRYAHNIISGDYHGRPILAFDYHYETHSTDSKGRRQTHHHHFTAVIIRANMPLKPLMIRPENMFDKLAGFFGFDDIDFESAEFSRRFCVKGPDRKWAYDVLHARTIEYLLSAPRHSLEFDHAHVIAWNRKCVGPEGIEVAASVIEGILDRVPEYVRQQQTAAL